MARFLEVMESVAPDGLLATTYMAARPAQTKMDPSGAVLEALLASDRSWLDIAHLIEVLAPASSSGHPRSQASHRIPNLAHC
jgi:hypothetical protein